MMDGLGNITNMFSSLVCQFKMGGGVFIVR